MAAHKLPLRQRLIDDMTMRHFTRETERGLHLRLGSKAGVDSVGALSQLSSMPSPEQELASFLAKYTPSIAALGGAAVASLQSRMPTAYRLVYDNYNALAVGFGRDERAGHIILSVALYPKWVSLFFMQGAMLDDPDLILRGSGKAIKHIVLGGPADLDNPAVVSLIDQALAKAVVPLNDEGDGPLIIKSISAKQRPRRPAS